MKLFCFPHAGGFANYYNSLREYDFGNIDDVHIYEYPGRGTKHGMPADKDMTERVRRAAEELFVNGADDGDYIIFGHSMGSFVGYETAKQLASKYNSRPALVIMSGQNPPSSFLQIRDKFDTKKIDVMEFLEKLGGVPDFLRSCPSAMNFYMSFIYSDMDILSSYEGSFPNDGELLPYGAAVFGRNDPIVFQELLNEWKKDFQEMLFVRKMEGGHFYMENDISKLCRIIDSAASVITSGTRSIMK